MIRRIFSFILALGAFASPVQAQGRTRRGHDADAGHLEPDHQLHAGQVADRQHDGAAGHRLRRGLEAGVPRLHRTAHHRERQGQGGRSCRWQERHGNRRRAAGHALGRRHAGIARRTWPSRSRWASIRCPASRRQKVTSESSSST